MWDSITHAWPRCIFVVKAVPRITILVTVSTMSSYYLMSRIVQLIVTEFELNYE